MLVSTKGRYALRMMIEIASHDDGCPKSIKEVSEKEELPAKYLEQLVRPLAKAGLIKSVRGQHGGYVLARPASEITTGDILRAAEGDVAPIYCLEESAEECPRQSVCPTISFWKGLDDVINGYLDEHTLDDLIASSVSVSE